jgi:hypothetical protein
MVEGRVRPADPSTVGGGDKDPNVSPARAAINRAPGLIVSPGVLKVLSSGPIPAAFPYAAPSNQPAIAFVRKTTTLRHQMLPSGVAPLELPRQHDQRSRQLAEAIGRLPAQLGQELARLAVIIVQAAAGNMKGPAELNIGTKTRDRGGARRPHRPPRHCRRLGLARGWRLAAEGSGRFPGQGPRWRRARLVERLRESDPSGRILGYEPRCARLRGLDFVLELSALSCRLRP